MYTVVLAAVTFDTELHNIKQIPAFSENVGIEL